MFFPDTRSLPYPLWCSPVHLMQSPSVESPAKKRSMSESVKFIPQGSKSPIMVNATFGFYSLTGTPTLRHVLTQGGSPVGGAATPQNNRFPTMAQLTSRIDQLLYVCHWITLCATHTAPATYACRFARYSPVLVRTVQYLYHGLFHSYAKRQ